MFRREVDLYKPVLELFARYEFTFVEVPFARKSVDLVVTTPQLHCLHAIEAKLRTWRAGLRQAVLNQLFAQRSYLAVPLPLARRAEASEGEFRSLGVGLIAVQNGESKILIPSRRSSAFRRKDYQTVKAQLVTVAASGDRKDLEEALYGVASRTGPVELLQIRNCAREGAAKALARYL